MRPLACTLFLAPLMAFAQVFYSDEDFYAYLEHKARVEVIQEERARSAAEEARSAEERARARRHEAVTEAIRDELDRQALEAIEWLRTHPSQ